MACDFQQCDILAIVDPEEPGQSPVRLRNYKFCSFSSLIPIEYSSD